MNAESRTPVTLLCDEAHLYLPVKDDADTVQRQARSFPNVTTSWRSDSRMTPIRTWLKRLNGNAPFAWHRRSSLAAWCDSAAHTDQARSTRGEAWRNPSLLERMGHSAAAVECFRSQMRAIWSYRALTSGGEWRATYRRL